MPTPALDGLVIVKKKVFPFQMSIQIIEKVGVVSIVTDQIILILFYGGFGHNSETKTAFMQVCKYADCSSNTLVVKWPLLI